jgi:hypothetical protein
MICQPARSIPSTSCNRAVFKATMAKDSAQKSNVGAWRSPVAYSLGVRVVGRSNRLAPTKMTVSSHER